MSKFIKIEKELILNQINKAKKDTHEYKNFGEFDKALHCQIRADALQWVLRIGEME